MVPREEDRVDGVARRLSEAARPWLTPSKPSLPWLVRAALAIPTAYHGAWNLGAEGARFWSVESGLPPALRFVVGGAEIVCAWMVAIGPWPRLAALALTVIFAGAIAHHAPRGFSFKHGGFEAPFVYALLALSLVTAPRSSPARASSAAPGQPLSVMRRAPRR